MTTEKPESLLAMVLEIALDRSETPTPLHQEALLTILISTAYMHSKIIIARIVLDFDITLGPKSMDWPHKCKAFDLVDRNPLYVKLSPRRKNTGETDAAETLD